MAGKSSTTPSISLTAIRPIPAYALETLQAAEEAGADIAGSVRHQWRHDDGDIRERFEAASKHVKIPLGIHTHNDCEMAVANAIAAVQLGAVQVQGTINGYGERCGNANLCSVIPNLELKLGMRSIGRENLKHLTEVSHYVSELANLPPSHGSALCRARARLPTKAASM